MKLNIEQARNLNRKYDFEKDRIIIWFSAGATSAVAAYLVCRDFPRENINIFYCDTNSEHPSNKRFTADVQRMLNHPIEMVKNEKYHDIWDLFEKVGYLSGKDGAPCTLLMKKKLRWKLEKFDDIQVFGYEAGEEGRTADFINSNPEVKIWCPLIERGLSKEDCLGFLRDRGIELPDQYLPQKSGAPYNHNNCIGCVKGGMGYWNKVRVDNPEVFDRMAKLERKIGHAILKEKVGGMYFPVYLDKLEPGRGNFPKEKPIRCDFLCKSAMGEDE